MNVLTPADVWAALGRLATTICTELETNRPDVVVVLHRSGAVVWHAVETVWAATRTQPLPPVVTVLIDRARADVCAEDVLINQWEYEDPKYVGNVVACVARREEWRGALCARLQAVLGATLPARIMVVDDVVDSGCTAVSALGLIWAVLPQAEAALYAGLPGRWRETLGRHWLECFYPTVAAQMAANWEHDKVALFGAQAEWAVPDFCWQTLVSGLARGPAPLSSIPLRANLPYHGYLTRYLAPAQWLEFSAWVHAMVVAKMHAYLAAYLAAAPAASPSPLPVSWQPRRCVLNVAELVWAQAFLREWSTLDQFAQHCRAAVAAIAPIVQGLVAAGEFIKREENGVAQYGHKIQRALVTADAWFGRYWGWLNLELVEERPVVTPFAVEYARADPEQAGAPMLIAVAAGQGTPVRGRLLLYGAGVERLGMPESILNCCSTAGDEGVTVACIKEFAGVTEVYAIHHTANLDFVLDPAVADAEKGRRLADLAAGSLTPETVTLGTDGIQYLINALALGVETRLTPYYRDALLQMAGAAPDLPTARRHAGSPRALANRLHRTHRCTQPPGRHRWSE